MSTTKSRTHHHSAPTLHAIIPPPIPPGHNPNPDRSQQFLYRPTCPQYAAYAPGGVVKMYDGSTYGTCSPNVGRNPFLPPWDFQCQPGGPCIGTNGVIAPTPNGVCCPSYQPVWNPRPYPVRPRSCCNMPDVNSCAICKDNHQGLSRSNAAGHFANMNRCKRRCGYW